MNQIIKDFAKAWETLDAELIFKHLSSHFKYDSQWVFESLDTDSYRSYLKGKFQTLKSKGITIQVEIVEDPYFGGYMLRLIQSGEPIVYRIKIEEGKVIKADMCMF